MRAKKFETEHKFAQMGFLSRILIKLRLGYLTKVDQLKVLIACHSNILQLSRSNLIVTWQPAWFALQSDRALQNVLRKQS